MAEGGELPELLPCPFCSGGYTRVHEVTHWTGMTSEVIAVEILHWCEQGRHQSRIVMRGKTREEATERWNRRAS